MNSNFITVKQKKPIFKSFDKYKEKNLECSVISEESSIIPGAKEYFDKYGYLIIKNLYDPKKLYSKVPKERGSITYFGSINEYKFTEEELQVPGSFARYNHPDYKIVHTKIRLILEDILGEKLYNTYYYDRFYFAGQELKRHSDRDSCEISVSVQISTNSPNPWLFFIQNSEGEENFAHLQNGWGVLYKGCEREHWRYPLQSRHRRLNKIWNSICGKQDDTYHHQIFFHYVRANGNRCHFANDSIK